MQSTNSSHAYATSLPTTTAGGSTATTTASVTPAQAINLPPVISRPTIVTRLWPDQSTTAARFPRASAAAHSGQTESTTQSSICPAQNIQGDTELTLAAASGDLEALKSLLGAGADREHLNKKGHCALVRAARNGHADVIRLLAGPAKDRRAVTPESLQLALAWAAARGHTGVVNILAESGDLAAQPTPDRNTALMPVTLNKHANTATELFAAAANGDMGQASLLLRQGISVDAADANGDTCLLRAAASGNYPFIAFLLAEQADIDHINHADETAMTLAAGQGHKEVVLELLRHGANILHRNRAGRNAEQCARDKDFAAIAGLLGGAVCFLKAAAQKNAEDFEKTIAPQWLDCTDALGRTALIIAAKNGCTANVALLIKKRAGLDWQDKDGNTALLIAASHDDSLPLLQELLSNFSRRPNLLLRNKHNIGIRELLAQPAYHYPQQRKLLLDAFLKYGRALLKACEQGQIATAETLLMQGADTTLKDIDGNCALHVAVVNNHHALAELLLHHHAPVDAAGKKNRSALCLAAHQGHIGIVNLLLRSGARTEGVIGALLSEAPGNPTSGGSPAGIGLNQAVILDMLDFHPYLSGSGGMPPVVTVSIDTLFRLIDDLSDAGAVPSHRHLLQWHALNGLSHFIISELHERFAEWGTVLTAMLARNASERVSDGQRHACWAAMLSALHDLALGPQGKKRLIEDHVPAHTVQRYSRLLKQQVVRLLDIARRGETVLFDRMLAFDAALAAGFARYGAYHAVLHYQYLTNCGMASVIADFTTFQYQKVLVRSATADLSTHRFAQSVAEALNDRDWIPFLDDWFSKTQDNQLTRALLNRQIDLLKLACRRVSEGNRGD